MISISNIQLDQWLWENRRKRKNKLIWIHKAWEMMMKIQVLICRKFKNCWVSNHEIKKKFLRWMLIRKKSSSINTSVRYWTKDKKIKIKFTRLLKGNRKGSRKLEKKLLKRKRMRQRIEILNLLRWLEPKNKRNLIKSRSNKKSKRERMKWH